ncbi:MAG: 16S rRNA (guanine(527)-N(7))-methyltransferase RsmG [Fibrobacterota bacterium]
MQNIDIFTQFIQKEFPLRANNIIEKFRSLHTLLIQENSKVNLISRKTPASEYWTRHFLDSLLAHSYVNFPNKTILDFGTGGGFPGLPLAILYPQSRFTLLDSTKKKLSAIERMASRLGLTNITTAHTRIEDAEFSSGFEIITCRSVKITPSLAAPLLSLLAPGGKICFYKAHHIEDTALFPTRTIHDASTPYLGTRKIIITER